MTCLLRRTLAALALCLVLSGTASSAEEKPAPGKTDFTIRSVRSGSWSAPDTWAPARIPGAGDRVLIGRKTRVVYDRDRTEPIRYLQIAGTLTFARDRNTTLEVGVVTVQATEEYAETGFDCTAHLPEGKDGVVEEERAALEVGTPEAPIPAAYTARIRLHFLPGMVKKDGPAIVTCGGRMDFHGAVLSRTWLDLGQTAKVGDTAIVLSEPVTGWRVGDEVILTGSKNRPGGRALRENPEAGGTEQRRIAKIDGPTLHLDQALTLEHYGTGEFRSEVANLSRNVIVESADPKGERGHTMYHRNSAGSISYARFAHLGKEGVLGRYPIHYHLVGTTMRGSSVLGVAVVDSHNRWVTIHGTQYLVVRDCVGYRSVGHGYFLEDATEVYNLLDRNLGVQAFSGKRLPEQVLPFDPNDGAAFWWANGRNSLVRNVACENEEYGFRYDCQKSKSFDTNLPLLMADGSKQKIDVRTVPLFRFEDNESHTEGLYGMVLAANGNNQPDTPIRTEAMLQQIQNIDWTGPDVRHPHVIRGLKIWEAHYAFRPHSPSMLIENLRIHRVAYGIYRPAFDNHVYRNVHLTNAGGEPFNRSMDDAAAQVGKITVDGLTIDGYRGNDQRHPLVHMSDIDLTGKAESHFRNVTFDRNEKRPAFNRGGSTRVDPYVTRGVPYYLHDYFGPGRHAKIVSTKAPELMKDGLDYRQLAPLTGDESLVAEIKEVAWPKLLDPVDDLPPATTVLSVRDQAGKLLVRGVSHDNGTIRSVRVNGKDARLTAIQAGVVDWEIELEKTVNEVTAAATDEAGNIEQLAHRIVCAKK
jgi:hypothetical protein